MSRRVPRTRRPWGLRSRDEHGAVAVVVALLMVPMIAFAALAVDLASLWAQRQQLQAGADAAVLAIGSDCLRGTCGTPASTATTFARANLGHGSPTATVTARTTTSVSVRNTAAADLVFAPVLGIRSRTVTTTATATWGAPVSGVGVLPVVVNLCEYSYQTGGALPTSTTSRTILLSRTSVSSCTESGFSSSYNPGGFAWVRPNNTLCTTDSTVGSELQAGSGPPLFCLPSYFSSFANDTVLLPVFTAGRGSGTSAYFKVHGYAPFKLTGYYLGLGYSWNAPCSGSDRCLRGYFDRLPEKSDLFTYGAAPHLGAGVLTLTN
jgi:Flp pilus assembly protein TadG